jgi:hypothetical protein
MKKLYGFLMLLLILAVAAPAVQAFPSLNSGDTGIYYTNREVVYRADVNGDYHELDFTDSNNVPILTPGDIFVGILNVQNFDDLTAGATYWNSLAGADELSGILAQEITSIVPAPGGPAGTTLQINLGAASTDTFTTLAGDTFSTGLTGSETMKLYADDNITQFNSNGTIVEDIADAIDGTPWMTLSQLSTDYAFTYITPQGTGVDDFLGRSFLGYSVTDFYVPGTTFTGVTDPEVGVTVDFYANSELEGHDQWTGAGGNSPWVFESNDPAFTATVPEPASFLLFGLGLLGFTAIARKKRA